MSLLYLFIHMSCIAHLIRRLKTVHMIESFRGVGLCRYFSIPGLSLHDRNKHKINDNFLKNQTTTKTNKPLNSEKEEVLFLVYQSV